MITSRILVAAACSVEAAGENVAVDMGAVVFAAPTAGMAVAPGCRVTDIVCARRRELESCTKGVTVSTAREGNWLDAEQRTARGHKFAEYCREATVDTLGGLSEHGGTFCREKKWRRALGRFGARLNSFVALCSLPTQFDLVDDTTSNQGRKARPRPSKKGERCSVNMPSACEGQDLSCVLPEGHHHPGNNKGLCATTSSDVSISPDGSLLYDSNHPVLPEGFREYEPGTSNEGAVYDGERPATEGRVKQNKKGTKANRQRRKAGEHHNKKKEEVKSDSITQPRPRGPYTHSVPVFEQEGDNSLVIAEHETSGTTLPPSDERNVSTNGTQGDLAEVEGQQQGDDSNTAASQESGEKSQESDEKGPIPVDEAGGDDGIVSEAPEAGGNIMSPKKSLSDRLRGTKSQPEAKLIAELMVLLDRFGLSDKVLEENTVNEIDRAFSKKRIKAAMYKMMMMMMKLLALRSKFQKLDAEVPEELASVLQGLDDQWVRLQEKPPMDGYRVGE